LAAAAGNAIAARLNTLVGDNQDPQAAEECCHQAEEAKTLEKCFGLNGTTKILRLCQVLLLLSSSHSPLPPSCSAASHLPTVMESLSGVDGQTVSGWHCAQ